MFIFIWNYNKNTQEYIYVSEIYQLYRWLSKILVFIETCGIMILLFPQNRPLEKHESFPYLEFYLKTKYNHPFHRIRMKKLVWMLKVSAQIHEISNLWWKKRFQNLLERRNSISHPLRAASIRIYKKYIRK